MAPNVCRSCLRALRQQLPPSPSSNSLPRTRLQPFSTTPHPRSAKTPQSRTSPPPPAPTSSAPPDDAIKNFASTLRSSTALRSTTEPYVAYGGTEDLFAACARQCSYTIPNALATPKQDPPTNAAGEQLGEGRGWWFEQRDSTSSSSGLGLPVTFQSWAQVLFLHMWLVTARLRRFPRAHVAVWHQNLLDHFFYAAEDRMVVWHNLAARGTRNKYLKDLFLQWRGVLLSYDEGLMNGDAVLAAAIWRNLFKASEEVDVEDVAIVTAYVRAEMLRLEGLSDEVVSAGQITFGSPAEVKRLLGAKESAWMRKAVTDEDVKAAKALSTAR
nr:cbp3-like protein [Quercus suber]